MESFGRYQLLERIAVGGMAEIFLARSTSLDGFEKDLVIKRIRPEFGQDDRFSSLFIDEARLSMTLSHPNIVQVFDFGHTDGAYYLAMEHIDGCDLDGISDLDELRGTGLDPALALLIMRDVCRGLDYAHNKKSRGGDLLGVIHRDISPQNIMVTFEGGTKVTDFGIAKALGKVSVTEPGMVLGKLAYMSPEHATGADIDRRTDIFACGVVLWELLVGKRVYSDKLGAGLYNRIRTADIDPPSAHNKKLPKKIDKLVMKAVALRLEDRFQTARDFGHEIHGFLTRNYPEASSYTLQEYLEKRRAELDITGFEDIENIENTEDIGEPRALSAPSEPGPAEALAGVVSSSPPPQVLPQAPTAGMPPDGSNADFDWTPELIEIVERFRRQSSLWLFLEMGDTCARIGQPTAAFTFYRVGAVKFAQHGLFAQSLLCCSRMIKLRALDELRAEVTRLPSLAGLSNQEIASSLFLTQGPVENLIGELLSDTNPSHGLIGEGTPLLRSLDGEAFVEFLAVAPLRIFAADSSVIEEGSSGRTMFLIAKGRVMISATSAKGERVYLSSLTAGDFFGENGFFTAAPRSATVEALYPVEAFEIDQAVYDRVMKNVPGANDILLRFYKERIIDVVLAKSPIFSLLPNDDRRAILDRFDLHEFKSGAPIITEGETSDQIYIIKNGEAEVFTTKDGKHEVLSTLGPGRLFGEVAALRGIPRTASVSARTDLATLCLSGAEFHEILDAKPELRQRVNEEVARRVRENIDRLAFFRPQT
ncbi:MAG: serine/threonine-protein kinase [Myxococcota bacterium]